jgi:hypothetical protein
VLWPRARSGSPARTRCHPSRIWRLSFERDPPAEPNPGRREGSRLHLASTWAASLVIDVLGHLCRHLAGKVGADAGNERRRNDRAGLDDVAGHGIFQAIRTGVSRPMAGYPGASIRRSRRTCGVRSSFGVASIQCDHSIEHDPVLAALANVRETRDPIVLPERAHTTSCSVDVRV